MVDVLVRRLELEVPPETQLGLAHELPWRPWTQELLHGAARCLPEVSMSHLTYLIMYTNIFIAPAWGGSAASGSRTPAWKADGSRTSYGGGTSYGGATAYGGGMGGGRTPAWNSGARTPYDSSSGSGFDSFAAGSRTPAWGAAPSGGRTPAWGGGGGSSASKGYDAPTPGGDYSAPTPGAYPTAPTPGASGSAATPRWNDNAPTPGALNAPTPGAYGGGPPHDAPTPAMAATPGATGDDNPTYLDDSE